MSTEITVAGYSILVTLGVAYELAGRLGRRTPTLAVAFGVLLRNPVARWAVLAGWMWVGWHVFVRSHH